ncbi:hypothetical protein U1Q18_003613 [Sarracenia purpurea var. burkii]
MGGFSSSSLRERREATQAPAPTPTQAPKPSRRRHPPMIGVILLRSSKGMSSLLPFSQTRERVSKTLAQSSQAPSLAQPPLPLAVVHHRLKPPHQRKPTPTASPFRLRHEPVRPPPPTKPSTPSPLLRPPPRTITLPLFRVFFFPF